ncbi:MAG TPA: translation initiation factor IF-3 [Pseudobdellovibrionaceae bacterium]|nr:translation initiation factor IF-3 [Pseudobdellovibrionaceae bacterium]
MNREIRAPQIRVIDDEGNMLGVMTVPEGIRLAEDKGLDLIEIAPTAQPPTCKLMDYGKWKYENKKKQQIAKKKQVTVQIKEIQMRPRTDQHDFETKMKHTRRFLLDGDKVKISIRFLGREMAYQDMGMGLMKRCIEFVNDLVMVEVPAKMEGRNMFLLLAPDAVKVKEYQKQHPQPAKDEAQLEKLEDLNRKVDQEMEEDDSKE